MNQTINQLPVLGVGTSLSLGAQPDPITLLNYVNGPDFIEYAGKVDVNSVIDEVQRIQANDTPILFHPSYINFCGSFTNNKTWLGETAKHIAKTNSAWFAQDCAYCFWQQDQGYSSQLGYFIPPILNRASLELSIERVKEVQAIIPVTVAIEPPPVSFVIGNIPVFDFFGTIANETGCAILLDMGHLVSYELATKKSVLDSISALPVERVIEVHIAGGKIKQQEQQNVYIDAHESEIQNETWDMLKTMLPKLPNVKAVCYECEGAKEKQVIDNLHKVKNAVKEYSASSDLLEKLEAKS